MTPQHVSRDINQRKKASNGIRSNVLVMPSVICSHIVADEIAAAVPGAVATSHDHGCGQIGADEATTRRTLINVGLNPNVSGAVIVGLGCETVQSSGIVSGMREGGLSVESVVIQEVGGTDECIARGIEYAEDMVQRDIKARDDAIDLGDLTIGLVASDVRDSTRSVVEPLAVDLIDQVIDAGGRVVMAGRERFLTDESVLGDRTASTDVAETLQERVTGNAGQYHRIMPASQEVFSLSDDEKRSLLGDHAVQAILEYGERALHEDGIAIVNASMQFEEAATAVSAAGAHLIVHLTAEGIPTGHPVVPVLKITGEPQTADVMGADIDIDGRESSIDTLCETVMEAANGQATCAEQHGVSQFSIARFGPSM